jgi:hypothetical protein
MLVACLVVACGHGAATSQLVRASSTAAAPIVFDLGRDFSLTTNPNGPWRYGYTRGTRLGPQEFSLDTVAAPTGSLGFWHPGPGSAGYYPYVAGNLGPITARDPTDTLAFRPGEVGLEASKIGQFAVIEFIVPLPGAYTVAADFAGIHKRLSTTDVHVLLDDEPLFSATIDGYGGDPALLPHQGAHPTASYRGTRVLRAGQILTFAVGFGPNHTHFNDTTGLILTIRNSPDPVIAPPP